MILCVLGFCSGTPFDCAFGAHLGRGLGVGKMLLGILGWRGVSGVGLLGEARGAAFWVILPYLLSDSAGELNV